MKFRDIVIFSGHAFRVPQGIQRIDHRATHGWQLRYGGTKLYSDHSSDGSGAGAALEAATKELLRRIAKLEAPTTLQHGPSVNKTSNLPVGISGPILRVRRKSKVRDASLSVSIPRFGDKARRRSVYIGTENTYTVERFQNALARAIEIRTAAEETYQRDATRAKRAQGQQMRQAARVAKESLKESQKASALSAKAAAAERAELASGSPQPGPMAVAMF